MPVEANELILFFRTKVSANDFVMSSVPSLLLLTERNHTCPGLPDRFRLRGTASTGSLNRCMQTASDKRVK